MMKTNFLVGLAITSLAGLTIGHQTRAQDTAAPQPPPAPAVHDDWDEHESEASAESAASADGDVVKRQRQVRIERRGPDGVLHVEEFSDDGEDGDDDSEPAMRIRRNGKHLEDHIGVFIEGPDTERRIVRIKPGEEDLIIRKSPKHRELRIGTHPGRPIVPPGISSDIRHELRRAVPARARGKSEHLEEAIRHLHEAEMPEAAASLEAELAKLRAQRAGNIELERELQRANEDREVLRKELSDLKRRLEELKQASKPE